MGAGITRIVNGRPGRPRRNDGFTFIELAAVLLILAVVIGLAFPVLQRVSTNDLRLTARRLVQTIYFLADRAAATKRTYRLHYNLDRHEYWVAVQTSEGEEAPPQSPLLKRTVFPESVRFKDVITLRQGKAALGEAYTDFHPVGRVDKTVLRLTDEAENTLTLVVNPLTGKVKVYEGYIEETERKTL